MRKSFTRCMESIDLFIIWFACASVIAFTTTKNKNQEKVTTEENINEHTERPNEEHMGEIQTTSAIKGRT